MVLVVISNIVAQSIERAVVAPSLLVNSAKEVVLGDEMSSAGVQTSSKEAGLDQVDQSCPAKSAHEQIVECEL